jgi:hypothetical protein
MMFGPPPGMVPPGQMMPPIIQQSSNATVPAINVSHKLSSSLSYVIPVLRFFYSLF